MESFFTRWRLRMAGAVSWPSVSTASFSAGHSLPADRAPRERRTSPAAGMAAPLRSRVAGMPFSSSSRWRFFARVSPPQSTSTALPEER